ncbi:hypothetical protein NC652_026745 [Populus alba x Populus x berolinensis]|nr:hypothetical protein NC652_026745 [Populus alba x Populus x berolinensis]
MGEDFLQATSLGLRERPLCPRLLAAAPSSSRPHLTQLTLSLTLQQNQVNPSSILHPYPSLALSHQPSEFNTYYDIEAVYNCLKKDYGIKQEDLILYGQSVGSGPTLHLASRL